MVTVTNAAVLDGGLPETPQPVDLSAVAPDHLEHLRASGLLDETIAARGYRTIDGSAEVRSAGYGKAVAEHCPRGILVPVFAPPITRAQGDRAADPAIVGYQYRPDTPYTRPGGRAPKYETLQGWAMRLDAPPILSNHSLLSNPSYDLWITEGVKKADAAAQAGACVIALLGVANWRGKSTAAGIMALGDWNNVALKGKSSDGKVFGRTVYIAFDSDVMTKPEVRRELVKLAEYLRSRGAHPHAVVFRSEHAPADAKIGFDDFLLLPDGSIPEAKKCVDDSYIQPQRGIVVTNRSGVEIHADALAAIVEANEPPQVFVHSGDLSRVLMRDFDGAPAPIIEPLGRNGLRNRLTTVTPWLRRTKDDTLVISHAPIEVTEHFLAMRDWPGIPALDGISTHPLLSPSGESLTIAPGYCPETRHFLTSPQFDEFDGTAAAAARYILHDFLGDFPFTEDADRAHALAMFLLPIVRTAITNRKTPLHLFDAPAPGTGKSLLVNAIGLAILGVAPGVVTMKDDEKETDKAIFSFLRSGAEMIVFDNVVGHVSSPALESALTGGVVRGRVLQESRDEAFATRCVWAMTSNNASLKEDMSDRTILCRLDARCERPRDRETAFKRMPIERYAQHIERPKLISACVRIIQTWIDEGRPLFTARKLGSFEEWSQLLGGILEVAEVPGFLANHDEFKRSRNPQNEAWREFVARWWQKDDENGDIPTRLSELLPIAAEVEFLAGQIRGGSEPARLASFGRLLMNRADRVIDGKRITRASTNPPLWKLVPVGGLDGPAQTSPATSSEDGERVSIYIPAD